MDVLVLPSRTTPTWVEQFGRVLVEAMWFGVPVVGSDSGEIPWVIESTGGGIVFPEGYATELAAILKMLREDDGRRRALGDAGQRAARSRFSVAASASALESLLMSAVASAT
jgi:glycosyltransferase involved in cell wall biosynthesis